MQVYLIVLCAIVTMGVMGYAYAATDGITLSTPSLVDTSGHQKSSIHAGEQVAIASVITNNSQGEKRFTYLVRVLDQNNQIIFQEGLSANIVPNQSFTVAETWIPPQAGSYNVQTVVLNGYMLSSPLTEIIQTGVAVK